MVIKLVQEVLRPVSIIIDIQLTNNDFILFKSMNVGCCSSLIWLFVIFIFIVICFLVQNFVVAQWKLQLQLQSCKQCSLLDNDIFIDFQMRTGDPADGCAIFWRVSRYSKFIVNISFRMEVSCFISTRIFSVRCTV